jgi:hypothetical protein
MLKAFTTLSGANWRQNSGVSSPWNCSVSSPHSATMARTVSALAFTNTPTLATNGGSAWMICAAAAGAMLRLLPAKNMKPSASAPASTAASASGSRVMPQILTLVRMAT